MRLITLFVILLALPVFVGAAPPAHAPAWGLPDHAVSVAPGLYYLGQSLDEGRMVEGYAIVRYKEGHAKPPGVGKDKPPKTNSCYEFLARGAKWKSVEPWVVNPTNNAGLSDSYVLANLADNIQKWETAAGKDILGAGTTTTQTLVADTTSTDGVNEVYFGSIDEPGVIGVTIIWGIFGGPPKGRELVEWDQIYNQDLAWSNTGESGFMDFESIATHELGHSVGMGDLYSTGCNQQTMYGYASEGELNKRDLEAGDIAGIKSLYK